MATSSTLIPRTLAAARTRSTRTTISTSLPKAAMKTTCRSRWPGSATMIAMRPATWPIPTGRTGPRQLFNPRRSQVSTTLWPVVSTATRGHDRQLEEKFNRKVQRRNGMNIQTAHLLDLSENCYEIAHVGVGQKPYWLDLLGMPLDFSASFASRRSRGKEGLRQTRLGQVSKT